MLYSGDSWTVGRLTIGRPERAAAPPAMVRVPAIAFVTIRQQRFGCPAILWSATCFCGGLEQIRQDHRYESGIPENSLPLPMWT
jgi:hypothetical protein